MQIAFAIILWAILLNGCATKPKADYEVWYPCSGYDSEPWAPLKICREENQLIKNIRRYNE